MPKFWLMARHEYLNTVRRRAFLMGTFGVPLFIALIVGGSILLATTSTDHRPVGYVDGSGLLPVANPQSPAGGRVEFLPYADETAAMSALQDGQLQAFYLLPDDYRQSRQIKLFYTGEAPDEGVAAEFNAFLRENLAAGLPAEARQRLVEGLVLFTRSADGSRELSRERAVDFVLPFIAGTLFIFSTTTSANYMLLAVTTEKENRTVEVMATSMSPVQLVGGKALGLMGVALTQLVLWVVTIVAAIVVGAQFADWLRGIQMPWVFLALIVIFFVPSFALIAGIMTAIGGAVTDMRQGQQIAGVLNTFFFLPFFFIGVIFSNPNSPILVGLSLFPPTALITISIRWGVTIIPAWQLIASWVLLVVTAWLSVLAAARVFRSGMLRYGQRLSLRSVLAAIRKRERSRVVA